MSAFGLKTVLATSVVSSALLFVEAGYAQGPKGPAPKAPAAAPAADPVKVATEAFKQGTALFNQKKFAPALEQFKKSYDTVASPNSGLYIARCLAEMGQTKEAFHQFRKVIAEADARAATEAKYAPTRDSAKTELDDLTKKIGVITISVKNPLPDSTLKVNGQPIPMTEWTSPIPVDPGRIEVVLTPTSGDPATKSVDVKAGEKPTIEIEPAKATTNLPPPPPPPKEKGSSIFLPLAIGFGGVGVVGMGMFGVAGGMSMSTLSELEDKCGNKPCTDPADADTVDRGEREQLIANIGLTVGAVGLAAGATFLIVDLVGGGGSSKEQAIDLQIGPGYVGARGKF